MAKKRLTLLDVHRLVSHVSLQELKSMKPREVAKLIQSHTNTGVRVLPATTSEASLFVLVGEPKKVTEQLTKKKTTVEKKEEVKVEEKKQPTKKQKRSKKPTPKK